MYKKLILVFIVITVIILNNIMTVSNFDENTNQLKIKTINEWSVKNKYKSRYTTWFGVCNIDMSNTQLEVKSIIYNSVKLEKFINKISELFGDDMACSLDMILKMHEQYPKADNSNIINIKHSFGDYSFTLLEDEKSGLVIMLSGN